MKTKVEIDINLVELLTADYDHEAFIELVKEVEPKFECWDIAEELYWHFRNLKEEAMCDDDEPDGLEIRGQYLIEDQIYDYDVHSRGKKQ